MTLQSKHFRIIQPYLLCIIICIIAQIASGLITKPAINSWYYGLSKPTFTPPNWLFAPVWSVLYLMMGFAWGHINNGFSNYNMIKRANLLFVLQLIFNFLWSMLYFGAHSIGYALIDIIFLWVALIFTTYQFFKISKLAGWLLIPYLLWLSYAVVLNASIWHLNQ